MILSSSFRNFFILINVDHFNLITNKQKTSRVITEMQEIMQASTGLNCCKACRFPVWPIVFYSMLLQPAATAKGRGLFWVPLEDLSMVIIVNVLIGSTEVRIGVAGSYS